MAVSSGMRNSWVPHVPEAPHLKLLKESGSSHLSAKLQFLSTPHVPPPPSHGQQHSAPRAQQYLELGPKNSAGVAACGQNAGAKGVGGWGAGSSRRRAFPAGGLWPQGCNSSFCCGTLGPQSDVCQGPRPRLPKRAFPF